MRDRLFSASYNKVLLNNKFFSNKIYCSKLDFLAIVNFLKGMGVSAILKSKRENSLRNVVIYFLLWLIGFAMKCL
jgi:hypothetical protein